MRHLRKDIETYLEAEPRARERSAKDRAIINVLSKLHPEVAIALERDKVSKERIIAFVQDYSSMDRAWRKILEERPELRGSDYDSKDELEKDVQRTLGYRV